MILVYRPYDGDAEGDGHLDVSPDERRDLELAARDRLAEHAPPPSWTNNTRERESTT